VRAATWVVTGRVVAINWPDREDGALEVARSAMPLDDEQFASVRELAAIAADELATKGDASTGKFARFSRKSLQYIVGATTGDTPAKADMLAVMSPWAECFTHGMNAFDERLAELEDVNPDCVP
jgi:hypothetical protein